jgi:glycogen operon protein
MLQAGDEFGRTQGGNNNAYCQDNEISWVDWRLLEQNADLHAFVQFLTQLRHERPEFRRETFFKGTVSRAGAKDVTWLGPDGTEMTHVDWLDGERRCLGVWLARGNQSVGRLLLLFNASHLMQDFRLPTPVANGHWVCRFDTQYEHVEGIRIVVDRYPLAPRSLVMLEC